MSSMAIATFHEFGIALLTDANLSFTLTESQGIMQQESDKEFFHEIQKLHIFRLGTPYLFMSIQTERKKYQQEPVLGG